MKETTTDCASPPRRLYTDKCMLKEEQHPAWEARRANKMRERFPTPDHQATPSMTLISPIQPSLPQTPLSGRVL